MLKQRVITAIVLLLVLAGVLACPLPWAFGALMTLFMAAAAWEWARLSGYQMAASLGFATVAMLGCAAMLAAQWHLCAGLALRYAMSAWAALWLLAAVCLLRSGVAAWPRIPRGLRMTAGLVSLWAAWLAVTHLHAIQGAWYLLSVLALVWVADIGAYFAGRAFGKRKLAPTISPGKSWAGAVGGAIGVVVLAVAGAILLQGTPNLYADVLQRGGWLALVLLALGIDVLSVLGDLLESLMKRGMGVKDSSRLLPGHGGVLDRIDSLLPVLPFTLAAVLWL
ncbi:MAG: phosphatidate cytidylyltransferase [Brachymonas sp.]|jgi:phosphatidate cytidylyltransferase|nr:phosphatidate cytidylyltransferase [Brachymonas sp.]MBP6138162.1 phosphatidate cytidylyltransferase [Brachymonas sp.]MBP6965958.1 phosphatidate cytidylyltransferase [Brachymonas sp.]MBP7247298.1 phosphatidate cytidylyltransferase [Brachymonas sp.]MBP7740059.1 phosphatidate cytidylyltransferase [Brachymonas sp.]